MARTWKQLVDEGQRLVAMEGDIKWQLGDVVLEVAPMGTRGNDNGATEKIDRYAEEINVEAETLRKYRNVASAWPNVQRCTFASWSVHEILKGQSNRFELIKTLPVDKKTGRIRTVEAWRAIGQKPGVANTNSLSTTEEKVHAVKTYLKEPPVRRDLVRDDRVRADWSASARTEDAHRAATVARKVREDAPKLVEAREYYEAKAAVLRIRQEARRAVGLLAGLPGLSDEQRDDLAHDLAMARVPFEYLDEFTKARRPAGLVNEIETFLAEAPNA